MTTDTRMTVEIRDATDADWAAIWPFWHEIVAAGETYTFDPGASEELARGMWMLEPPGRTVVAVDGDGAVVASAKMNPNHAGPGACVASASFMVEPRRSGQGIGRALCEEVIHWSRAGGFTGIQFNAVVETNVNAIGLYESLGFRTLATVPRAFELPDGTCTGICIMHLGL